MDVCKNQEIHLVNTVPNSSKSERVGRWSKAEKYMFQSLLYKFGTNWKKIHQVMNTRSLAQIRSHAQKFFDKLDASKKLEYKRKANLFQSMQLLRSEMLLKQDERVLNSQIDVKPEQSASKDAIYSEKDDDITSDLQEQKEKKSAEYDQKKEQEQICFLSMRQKFELPFFQNNVVPVINSYPGSFAPYVIQMQKNVIYLRQELKQSC